LVVVKKTYLCFLEETWLRNNFKRKLYYQWKLTVVLLRKTFYIKYIRHYTYSECMLFCVFGFGLVWQSTKWGGRKGQRSSLIFVKTQICKKGLCFTFLFRTVTCFNDYRQTLKQIPFALHVFTFCVRLFKGPVHFPSSVNVTNDVL